MNNKSININLFTDNDLYKFIKRYLIQEFFGIEYNQRQCDLLINETQKRNPDIYFDALNDAANLFESIKMINDGNKAINLRRIDSLSSIELKLLLQTVGAATKHQILDDSFSIFNILKDIENKDDNYFACNVSGNSMEGANIFDGDTIIVEKTDNIKTGNIIVVSVEGNLFVKRIKIEEKDIWLISENKQYKPFKVLPDSDFQICGVAKIVLRAVN